MEEENYEKKEGGDSNMSSDRSPPSHDDGEKSMGHSDVSSVVEKKEEKPVVSMGAVPNHNHEPSVKKEQQLAKSMRQNPWMLSTIVLGAVVLLLLFLGNFSGGVTGNVVSSDVVGDSLVEYLNTIADGDVVLVDVEDDGAMYLVTVEYKGEELPIYVTKDGEYYTPSLLPITGNAVSDSPTTNTPAAAEVVKSDNPEVELFVMTHCPYGTQAEKGFLPAYDALKETGADISIKFVHYFLHKGEGEEPDETPRQICIREEQPDKFIKYLGCFLEGNGESPYVGKDPQTCMDEVGIDSTVIDDCISSGRADEYYAADSALSQQYGVQGSPTLVVNGAIVQSGRSAAAYVDTICSTFNDAPEACVSADVSSVTPGPGFGFGSVGEASAVASC
jgi:hypothetical protein